MTHIPTGIVVSCQNERSQIQNKATAMNVLQAKLLERRRQEEQAKMDALKGDGGNSWGNQMRSYVLHPYQMVKDLRTEFEVGNPRAVFDGEIDGFLEAGHPLAQQQRPSGLTRRRTSAASPRVTHRHLGDDIRSNARAPVGSDVSVNDHVINCALSPSRRRTVTTRNGADACSHSTRSTPTRGMRLLVQAPWCSRSRRGSAPASASATGWTVEPSSRPSAAPPLRTPA